MAVAEAAITMLMARGQCLVIDLSALDFMDCCALGALKRIRAQARHGGGNLVLAAPQPLVRRLLALTRADDVFLVEASVDAAVAGIARRRNRGVTSGTAEFPPPARNRAAPLAAAPTEALSTLGESQAGAPKT